MDVCQTSIISDAVVKGRSTRAIAAMREELDSPCTEEIAAFDRFIDLASRDTYDATVFDMAPTGHAPAPARDADRVDSADRHQGLRVGRNGGR